MLKARFSLLHSFLYLQIVLVLKSLQMYETTRITVSIQIFSHVLAYTNLCIANPILYNCFSENFRKAFRKVSKPHTLTHAHPLDMS